VLFEVREVRATQILPPLFAFDVSAHFSGFSADGGAA